jgi:hypothetical protein
MLLANRGCKSDNGKDFMQKFILMLLANVFPVIQNYL